MRRLTQLVAVFSLCVVSWLGLSGAMAAQAATWDGAQRTSMVLAASVNKADAKLGTEFGKKLDINNTNISSFQAYRGLYPTIAQAVIANAPYASVNELLSIPGLSEAQKSLIQSYINDDVFTVTEVDPIFNEGDDRINNGAYK
jgi:photosystem II PsbU protein